MIDWRRPAEVIADQVRALAPEVGAHTELGGRRVLVWKAVATTSLAVGDDARDRLVVPCGRGYLEIVELQEAGRRRMTRPGVPARRRPAPGAGRLGRWRPATVAPARGAALRVLLREARSRAPFDLQGATAAEFAGLETRDRALAYELVMGTIKRRNSLDRVIAAYSTVAPAARAARGARGAASGSLPAPLPRPRAGARRGVRRGRAGQGARAAHGVVRQCRAAQGRRRRARRACAPVERRDDRGARRCATPTPSGSSPSGSTSSAARSPRRSWPPTTGPPSAACG